METPTHTHLHTHPHIQTQGLDRRCFITECCDSCADHKTNTGAKQCVPAVGRHSVCTPPLKLMLSREPSGAQEEAISQIQLSLHGHLSHTCRRIAFASAAAAVGCDLHKRCREWRRVASSAVFILLVCSAFGSSVRRCQMRRGLRLPERRTNLEAGRKKKFS